MQTLVLPFAGNERRKACPMPRHHSHGPIMAPPIVYDLITSWFVMRGREQTFRSMVVDLAGLRPGEAVLDVGCGTGTLAIAAKRRIGESGRAVGVDPSAQLLAGARRKGARQGLSIEFQLAGIERLDLPDHSFDAALGTFMTHHVPHELLPRGLDELGRVLRPGGRVVLVDFTRPEHHPVPPASPAGRRPAFRIFLHSCRPLGSPRSSPASCHSASAVSPRTTGPTDMSARCETPEQAADELARGVPATGTAEGPSFSP